MPKKILIAEDDMALAKALRLKLTNAGLAVMVVEDGAMALAELKRAAYDLLLLDLMMPNVDGFAVLAAIKQMKKKPIIFVASNLSQASDKNRALKLGADDYLVKADVSLAEIVAKIKKALKVQRSLKLKI